MRGEERSGGNKSFQKNNPKEKESTFFVENLPDGVSNTMLWKAFSHIGIVTDAYVAKKKDAKGKPFGFIRFIRVREVKADLVKMNLVKIKGVMLTVSIAKYDKKHSIQNKAQRFVPNGEIGGKPKVSNPSWRQEGVSYRDAVKTTSFNHKIETKNLVVMDEDATYPSQCKGRAIIGVAQDLNALENLVYSVDKYEKELGLSYIGGLSIIISCKNRKVAEEVMTRNKQRWSVLVSRMFIWNGEELPNDRVAKLSITGLPLQLRDGKLYDRIGELFGKVVSHSEFTWRGPNNAMGECHVLVPMGKRIDEEVSITWKNKKCSAWVREDFEPWMPRFRDEITENESPFDLNGAGEDNGDLEDGEFRYKPMPEGNNSGEENCPFIFQAGNQTASHMEKPNIVHEFHGESKQKGGALKVDDDECGSQKSAELKNKSGPEEKKREMGSSTLNGPPESQVLGKRNRAIQSPPSLGSRQGPSIKKCQGNEKTDLQSFDLNSPPPREGQKSGEHSGQIGDQMEDSRAKIIDGAQMTTDPEDKQNKEKGDEKVDVQNIVNEVGIEVDVTKQVGELIGISLRGFDARTKEIIAEDGGYKESQ